MYKHKYYGFRSKPDIKYKNSYGIILIRKKYNKNINQNIYEVLLCKKRTTFGFYDLIINYMQYKSESDIKNLLNMMTIEEKQLLYNINSENIDKKFKECWKRIYGCDKIYNRRLYKKYLEIFKITLRINDIYKNKKFTYIQTLIHDTISNEIPWELPRGRINGHMEKPIDCAIRELFEETDIKNTSYNIIPDFYKSYRIKSDKIIYNYGYYLAIYNKSNNNSKISISLKNKEQIKELSNVKWLSMDIINKIDPNLYTFIKPAIKYIKHYKLL